MAILITAPTLTEGWLGGVQALVAIGGEAFDLMVEIVNPNLEAGDESAFRSLDAFLIENDMHDTRTVANTIFPNDMAHSSRDRAALYSRYRELLPRLHRLPGNGHGLYFERLISYPLQRDPLRANQLELTISRLHDELQLPGPLKHAYELEIHAPGVDTRPMGFPCMSALSFHLDSGRLRLAATYRNQYYVQRALGNFLGLARLQAFVAAQVDLPVAALSVHAFHAQIDPQVGKHDMHRLLASMPAEAARFVPA